MWSILLSDDIHGYPSIERKYWDIIFSKPTGIIHTEKETYTKHDNQICTLFIQDVM